MNVEGEKEISGEAHPGAAKADGSYSAPAGEAAKTEPASSSTGEGVQPAASAPAPAAESASAAAPAPSSEAAIAPAPAENSYPTGPAEGGAAAPKDNYPAHHLFWKWRRRY